MKEKGPVHADDQRLRTRLHELRAKVWIGHVMEVSGLNTPYKLDQKFDGGQPKWKAYQSGKMPNDMTVHAVQLAYPGTRDWIERGPAGLALWPALGHQDIEVLTAIYSKSKLADGQIAFLRVEAMCDRIDVQLEIDDEDDFIIGEGMAIRQLMDMEVLPEALCEEVSGYLHELMRPLRTRAYQIKSDEANDQIGETPLTSAARQAAREEMLYETACLESIGNKGHRSDLKPDLE